MSARQARERIGVLAIQAQRSLEETPRGSKILDGTRSIETSVAVDDQVSNIGAIGAAQTAPALAGD